MFTQALILSGLLIGQPPEIGGPRLEKGLEVRWTGTFTEASFRPGVRALRTYDVETRLFVLDTTEGGANVVLFNRVFLRPDRRSTEPPAGVVRLDLARVNAQGKVQVLPSPADPDNPEPRLRPWPLVQLQGLPTHEAGVFLEFPDQPLSTRLAWSREEAGRPGMAWKVASLETYRGQPAVKIIGEQKTPGFYADQVREPEWRRQDTLTVVPAKGFAARLERVIERREPGSDELAFRSVLSLEQQGAIVYPGRLYQERRDEGVHAAAFTAMLDRLLANGGRDGPQPFEALVRRCQTYLSDHGASDNLPYREAVLAVRKRAESAAKGNLPPLPPADPPAAKVDPLTVGQPIADATVPAITAPGPTRVSDLKGTPVLLIYFQPAAASGSAVLGLANDLHARKLATVVPLAIGDPADSRQLVEDGKLNVPVYDGTGTYKTHGLEATPVFILLDAEGVIRSVTRGWGGETAPAVTREFERWAR